jgi:hypothetical protein
MSYEPNEEIHYIFDTYEEAITAYMNLSIEEQELIAPPRQSHNCWVFDKIKED